MTTLKTNLSLLRELFALKEVMDAGQIQGAAQRNGMKQSNLSKMISDLESEINVKLLNRSSKGVEPTNTARLLYADIDNIVKSLDKISATFVDSDELTGYVTVFVGDGFIGHRLLTELSLFYARHLKIRLDILTDKRTAESDIDLAIVDDLSSPVKEKVLFKSTGKQHLYASRSYLAKRGAPKDMKDLLQNFDLCVQQRHLNEPECQIILKKAKHLNTTSDAESIVLGLVLSGDGITMLHDWRARYLPDLVRLDLPFELTHTYFGVCNAAVEKTSKIQTMLHYLKSLPDTEEEPIELY